MADPVATMDAAQPDTALPLECADKQSLHPIVGTNGSAQSQQATSGPGPETYTIHGQMEPVAADGVDILAITEPQTTNDAEVEHDSIPEATDLQSHTESLPNQSNDVHKTSADKYVFQDELADNTTVSDAVIVNENVAAPGLEDEIGTVGTVDIDVAPSGATVENIADDTMKPDFEYNSLENDEEPDDQRRDDVNEDVDVLPASPLHVILDANDDEDDAIELDVNAIDDDEAADDEHNALDDDIVAQHDVDEDDEAEHIGRPSDNDDDLECDYSYSPMSVTVGTADEDDEDDADCIIPDRPQPLRTGKKRRRILALTSANEGSSDDDEDVGNSLLDDEPLTVSAGAVAAPAADAFVADAAALDDLMVDERLEQLVKNEKPGPRSKKASTQLLMELQARALLQSAIVIPVAVPVDGKKRKMRILESDDDEDVNLTAAATGGAVAVADSLDDIGIEAEQIDLDADTLGEQLIIGDPVVLPLLADDMGDPDVVNVAELLFLDEPGNGMDDDDDEVEDEVEMKVPIEEFDEICSEIRPPEESEQHQVKTEKIAITPEKRTAVKVEAASPGNEPAAPATKNNGESPRSHSSPRAATPPVRVKDEPKPSLSRPGAQLKSLYTSSEDEYLPNDVYFGTPDRYEQMRKPRGRGRGSVASPLSRYDATHHRSFEQKKTGTRGRGRGRGRGRPASQKSKSYRQQYESESCSTEESSSSDSEARYPKPKKTKTKSSAPYHQLSKYDAGPSKTPAKPTKRKVASSRFKDKSRKIPNDVYFDAKVPLHVLYSYGTESSEDELPPFPPLSTITGRPLNKSAAHKTRGGSSRGARGGRGGSNKSAVAAVQPSHSSTTSKRGRKPSHCTSNADIRLKHMRKCFRAAGFQKQRLRELWKESDSTVERADKILYLLCDNGLVGDPTVDNCRLLRKSVVCNEEARELDPSLIIQAEGRTRRSVTAAKTAVPDDPATTTGTAATAASGDNDVAQATLSNIKKLIDSDSDDE